MVVANLTLVFGLCYTRCTIREGFFRHAGMAGMCMFRTATRPVPGDVYRLEEDREQEYSQQGDPGHMESGIPQCVSG